MNTLHLTSIFVAVGCGFGAVESFDEKAATVRYMYYKAGAMVTQLAVVVMALNVQLSALILGQIDAPTSSIHC